MAIKITKEEFEKKFGHLPAFGASPQTQPVQQGFLGEAKTRISNVAGQIGQQFRGEGEFAGQSDIRKPKTIYQERKEGGMEKLEKGKEKGLNGKAKKPPLNLWRTLLLNILMRPK